jgi:protein SCO1/2
VSGTARVRAAVSVLSAIVAITASWWALALWPVGGDAPEWLLRTREVCFGSKVDALPSAAGWLLLVGQPISMVILLVTIWGAELRAGLTLAIARAAGQLALGVGLALVVAGLGAVVRVRTAKAEPFSTGTMDVAARLTRVSDVAPAVSLIDQSGREVSLESFRGRPVIVTFAFAHCETVCPLIVADVLAARQRIDGIPPPVLIVTLDPWRDTPSRLASIAASWRLDQGVHVLSGASDAVERTLNAWRVPRARNQKTGDISHPSIVYIVDADGRIAYVVTGGAEAISAAVRAL